MTEEIIETIEKLKEKLILSQNSEECYMRQRDDCLDVIRTIYAEYGEDTRINNLCNSILVRYSSYGI